MDSLERFPNISYEDIERMVAAAVEEDLHLEYKSGRPRDLNKFKNDIASDVAAFANSDGGLLLIGVTEVNQRPHEIDGTDGIKVSRESIGQTIAAKVRPTVPGLRISVLRSALDESVIAVVVPRSGAAPHQGPGHVYYRRHEHHNQPLAHHEIEDLRLRRIAVLPLIGISTATRGSVLAAIDVRNQGEFEARNIKFHFPANMPWLDGGPPPAFTNGIKSLSPGQHLRFRCSPFPKLFADGEPPAVFDVGVEYTHSLLDRRESYSCTLDFEAYRDSMSTLSDEQEDRRKSVKELENIGRALTALKDQAKDFARLVGANGLDLSSYTLRNLRRIASGGSIERLSPKWFTAAGFQDALGIDIALASRLETLFRDRLATGIEVREVEGMTDVLLARFEETFEVDAPIEPTH